MIEKMYYSGLTTTHIRKEESHKRKERITTESHHKGSSASHNGRKEDAKANGIDRSVIQENFYRQMVNLKERVSIMGSLLQEREKDHIYG